jgi:hypothetical protein
MKRLVLSVLIAIFAVGGASLFTWLTTDEEDYNKVAVEIFERELARAGVRSDAFRALGVSNHNGSVIYAWASKVNTSGRVGVTISRVDDDFWGNPIIPDCHKAYDETVRYFGEVCR